MKRLLVTRDEDVDAKIQALTKTTTIHKDDDAEKCFSSDLLSANQSNFLKLFQSSKESLNSKMSDTNYWLMDYDISSPAPPGFPRGPTVLQPMPGHPEQGSALCFVGLLVLLLLFLVVRCVRIILDPYSSMPSSSWTDHKEGLDRAQFDYAIV